MNYIHHEIKVKLALKGFFFYIFSNFFCIVLNLWFIIVKSILSVLD